MAPRKVTFFKVGGGGLGVARRTTLLPDDGGPTLAAIQRLHYASANAKAPQRPWCLYSNSERLPLSYPDVRPFDPVFSASGL